jgi:hypothetical protein
MKKFTHETMKRLLVVITLVVFSGFAFGQMPAAITISPSNATAYDQITLTLNATAACFQDGSLVGVPLVYMHSGVTYGGNNWQDVVEYNSVGHDGTPTTLTPNLDGTFSITFTPFTYYDFPPGTVVTQLCAVFNDGQWDSKDARDFDAANPPNCKDFFIPLSYTSSEPKFHFIVNMEKIANEGGFDPLSDAVWVHLQSPLDTAVELAPGVPPDVYKYSGMIESGLDSGVTYQYKFRINTDVYETVDREITAVPGTTTADVWWNDEAINSTTFKVDMSYMVELGVFDTVTDFMDIAGSMNGWAGSAHMTQEANSVYSIDYQLDQGTIYEYKFRINGDWNTSEFPSGGPNRMMRGPNAPTTINHFYDDYNPATVPMLFNCNMSYQITAGHFDPSSDYLDIAGNINGWGGYDVLFDGLPPYPVDSIFSIKKLIDTSYIGGSPVEFKFRFNGDWNTSEFPGGGPNRKYDLLDTAGGVTNVFDCWYDDKDPSIPTPPWAYNLAIQGTLLVGETLTGSYTYEDVNGDPEGVSLYQWYWADDQGGTNETAIQGATAITFVPTASEAGKFVAFEVTPVAASGDSLVGKPVKKYSDSKVGGVGINDITASGVTFYPNPVSGYLTFENLGTTQRIEIYSIMGQKMATVETKNLARASYNTSQLVPGVYFMKFIAGDNSVSTAKFIRK